MENGAPGDNRPNPVTDAPAAVEVNGQEPDGPDFRPLIPAVGFVFILAGYWLSIQSFHRVWSSFVYSHGYLVALVVLYAIWDRRHRILANPEAWPAGLILILGFTVIWLFAAIMNIQVIHQAAFLLVLLAWATAVLGLGPGKAVLPVVGTLFLVVPFWEALIPILQGITVAVSGAAVRLLGFPATIQGEYISLPSGVIQVAGTCSGLQSFMVGLALGAIYCLFFLRGWRGSLAIMALAAGFAMASNWIRVGALVIIGHMTEMQSGLLADHVAFGWVIFTVCLVPFFALAHWVQKREARRRRGKRPAAEAHEPEAGGPSQRYVVLATSLSLVGPVVFLGFRAAPAAEVPLYHVSPSSAQGSWEPMDPGAGYPASWRPAFRGFDGHDEAAFARGDDRVHVDHLVYRDQTQGQELIGYPNRIAPDSVLVGERLLSPTQTSGPWVMEALVRTPDSPLLVWYWYRIGGIETPFAPRAKAMEVVAFFLRRRTAELVALSAPCTLEDCQEASEALRGFVQGN